MSALTHRSPLLGRLSIAVFLVAVIGACERSQVDPRWGSLISARTHGVISQGDMVRIVFTRDVAGEHRIGRPLRGVLDLKPMVEGAVTFVSARELVFSPAANLPSGREFVATLSGEALLGVPENLGEYWFTFEIISQDFEVDVEGLDAEPGGGDGLVLSGTILTADFAESEAVKGILTAKQGGRNLDIQWQHGEDSTTHRFTVEGVARSEEDNVVKLQWHGRSIGVSSRGNRDVTVPARDVFRVTSVRARSDDRQYALVRFSNPIDPNQNLDGLVGLGDERFTLEATGSILRIIPRDRIIGLVSVVLEPGIRGAGGQRLEERSESPVTFTDVKPGVRFAGSGVVLPPASRLTVPIEASNVHSVQVTAFRVFESNISQFLQTNDLSGNSQLRRTGRALWRRTFELPAAPDGGWTRYSLDLSDIANINAESLLRLTLSINRGNSTFACTEEQDRVPVIEEPLPADLGVAEGASWTYWEGFEAYYQGPYSWNDRDDPCTDAYFRYSSDASDSRNFLASNIGMTVKKDPSGGTLVATTDLRTSEPMRGVLVTFMNYQNQPLGSVVTGPHGLARTTLEAEPFYALADIGEDKGYLKINRSAALPTSHFDVGGEVVAEGLKGRIYGERGVWRPGDDIHLTFALDDARNPVPADHPATLRLYNPMGQVVHTVTNTDPVGGFYVFPLRTAPDAPTGNWSAAVEVGGARFSSPVRVETVMPNRLKVDLDLGSDELLQGGVRREATLFGQWLSGAVARNLRAEVEVAFQSANTTFSRFSNYTFDDPAREYASDPSIVFDGSLDDEGYAAFISDLASGGHSPGMLTAAFATRIFEASGAFSTNRRILRFSPYDRYIGVRVPPGDAARGMLLTDTPHTVDIVSLSPGGDPASVESIDVTLYKIEWRWWWDRSAESLARFTESEHTSVVAQGQVATTDGRGSWTFQVDYPGWGRYLLRACDAEEGHCTGKTLYIDWPGWAGRPQDQSGSGASMLTVLSDRPSYTVGDVAEIQLPDATSGRALVTLETGTQILDQRWVVFDGGRVRFEVPITRKMAPNVYVSVSLIQPHSERVNDRPIRLFGVIPLEVEDPLTVLQPEIGVPEEWRPSTTVTVGVSEASGRPINYTLAVVDEGLLSLTNFEAPNLHDYFYSKEALGVATWDIFDDVAGAYGAELERILAIGGDDAATLQNEQRSRFPPVVRFMGPFTLRPGGRRLHAVDIPEYIGQVRVMVVAGHEGAYGSASESVFVRQPLSMLATVPRVVGPGEEIAVSVSLFAMADGIDQATVTLDPGRQFEVVGSSSEAVRFNGAEERMARLYIRAGERPGQGMLRFTAVAGEHSSRSESALNIRTPNPVTTRLLTAQIAPGERWEADVQPHGIPGTNLATLEVTPRPPLNLEKRLGYLERYPHGCLEQTVSAVFPQLYLPSLVYLDPAGRSRMEESVRDGIERVRRFQLPSGGFSYWPGDHSGRGARNGWATNYAGHFLIEAERLGFYVDPSATSIWKSHQRLRARSWRRLGDTPAMEQAYRLYTLALAGAYEIGAMNRLRESGHIEDAARWHLAAAYSLAGIEATASRLILGNDTAAEYQAAGWSMGSWLRDSGILLDALVRLGRDSQASRVAEDISDKLYSDTWHSTHSIAYALFAMTRFFGLGGASEEFTFEHRVGANAESVRSSSPVYSEELAGLAEQGGSVEVVNTSDSPLFVTLTRRGSPAAGEETASSAGLKLQVEYTDRDGESVDVSQVLQGTDLYANVTVLNESGRDVSDLALKYMAPSGWEIHNERMDLDEILTDQWISYQDVRDDRVLTYFSLDDGHSQVVRLRFNAAYLGKYYLPSITVEAMYDASIHGGAKGMWVEVVEEAR